MSSRSALAKPLLLLALGCRQAPADQQAPRPLASDVSLKYWLRPHASSPFVCQGAVCRQLYPRLPSKDEWRCAEGGKVVWCASAGEAAGTADSAAHGLFRCAPRWGSAEEKALICVDRSPEYPDDPRPTHCKFEQEQGVVRVCTSAGSEATSAPLPGDGLASCWLDRDCPSHGCDRGVCRCSGNEQCAHGTCRAGYCVETAP